MVGEQQFIEKAVKDFYSGNWVSAPPDVEKREFGVGSFGKKIASRHLSFSSDQDFNYYLQEQAPLFISYSNARYEFPSRRPMSAKNLLGADIVYEFDADDFKIDCQLEHNSWKCSNPDCGAEGKGIIANCTKCGSPVSVEEFFCPKCLDEAKSQVFRLIDFLEKDFSFTDGISVNFSGNAGYHVHIRSKQIVSLSKEARIELLDYLTGNGLDSKMLGFAQSGKMMLCPVPSKSTGWQKRLGEGLVFLIKEGNAEKIASLSGQPAKKISSFLDSKKTILRGITEKGILHSFPGNPKTSADFWNSLIEHVAGEKSLDIDRQTSIDMHKIIRVPGTIHGGTGLLAKTVSVEELKQFNPFNDAIVFSATPVKVFIKKVPKIFLGAQWFGPFEGESVELPEYAAAYLVAGGKASLGEGLGNQL